MPTHNASPDKISLPSDRGISRRAFLQQTGVAALVAGLLIYKPCIAKSTPAQIETTGNTFSKHQKAVLTAIQLQLFPADNNGPSATDINATSYLEWALNDPKNREDGDRAFIIKGIGWLEDLSAKAHNQSFIKLSSKRQHQLIEQLSTSDRGDSWISLLVYYLLESLLLDPVYGGNVDEAGWKWLEHQPGFPRPTAENNYQHYLSEKS